MEIIPRSQQLIVYGYLVEKFSTDAGAPAIELLFTVFQELQKEPTVPEFVIWSGSFGHSHWWIGVPATLPEEVTNLLREYLSGPSSYDTMDLGEVPDMGLIPRWKYTSTVIYSLASISGGDDVDVSSYGSSLPVEVLSCLVTDET